uniref:hypothetical protein n=1 Tax=Simplicispira psychrophila TaxID=80882 RepID=UPI0012EC264A
KSKTPMQTMKDWHQSHPQLFNKRPYDRPGCDTPKVLEDGRRIFPNHGFRGCGDGVEHEAHVQNGNVRLGVVTVSEPDIVSLIEVYLHTVYKKHRGRLPAFNHQIG